MASNGEITRITLFKIPNAQDVTRLLEIYKEMPTKAVKVRHTLCLSWQHTLHAYAGALQDGKPYILNVKAGPAKPDQRAQGFTLAVVSTFASQEDMVYYDEECAAHKALKVVAKDVHQGVMMVFFENIMP